MCYCYLTSDKFLTCSVQAISELDVVYALTSVDVNALNVICYDVLGLAISSFFVKSGRIHSHIWQ